MTSKSVAMLFGIVFTLVGLLGFIGGVGIVGEDGIFATNTLHDLVHLVSGIIFLIVAYTAPQKSAATLMIFGVVYGLVAILGFMNVTEGTGDLLGLLINNPDNYLHVVLALGAFFGGYLTRDDNRLV